MNIVKCEYTLWMHMTIVKHNSLPPVVIDIAKERNQDKFKKKSKHIWFFLC